MSSLLDAVSELRATCDEIETCQARALRTIRAVAQQIEAMGQAMDGERGRVMEFSQRDERWSGVRLGTGDLTLGQAGCLVTCAASVLCDAGYATDPAHLNAWLNAHGGFVGGNLFVWGAIDALGAVRFAELIECPGMADVPVERIRAWLAAGNFCIAQVDFNPGGAIDQHWVRLVDVDGNGRVMDPWPLAVNMVEMCPHYGPTPSVAIWKVGLYARV